MKNLFLILIISIVLIFPFQAFAGNDQRIGEAGASELLVNPWAKSSGWGDAGAACVNGIESVFSNIAGLSFSQKLEVAFSHTQYMVPSGIMLNNGGVAVRVGKEKNGVLAVSVMNMSWGEIEITTNNMPDGTGGTFNPSYTIIGLSYAREFSNSIHGGLTVKLVNESIATISSSGVCFDAGIQYVTGLGKDKNKERYRDNLKFGIALKNVGSTMKYSGDGLSFFGISPDSDHRISLSQRSQEFEMPSLIRIGLSYDIHFWQLAKPNDNESDDEEELEYISNNKLVIAATFTANSYTQDQISLGLEYSFKNILYLRAGYTYEKEIFSIVKDNPDTDINEANYYDYSNATTNLLGPSCGVSLQWPLKNSSTIIAADYSYRFLNMLRGTHTFGIRVTL